MSQKIELKLPDTVIDNVQGKSKKKKITFFLFFIQILQVILQTTHPFYKI